MRVRRGAGKLKVADDGGMRGGSRTVTYGTCFVGDTETTCRESVMINREPRTTNNLRAKTTASPTLQNEGGATLRVFDL